jgi:serine/threonine protein kinase
MAQSSSENELGSVAAAESITILKKLGQGQFGSVHLAETSSGELRAVKRIKVARMRSQKDVQNLDREIKLLKVKTQEGALRVDSTASQFLI